MDIDAGRIGRPRSEQARTAVLHAVDDLLVEVGYAAMTMKGIAERAEVGRQTVYRWWSTKAEILAEAISYDAPPELEVASTGSPERDLIAYLKRLQRFLTKSETGTAYRALLGEAQHDPEVAALVAANDPVIASARRVLVSAFPSMSGHDVDLAVTLLVGPMTFGVLSGQPVGTPTRLAAAVLDAFNAAGNPPTPSKRRAPR